MKKYLLLLLTMLTTSLGAWAEEGTLTEDSEWEYSDNVLTITFSSQLDYTGVILNDLKNNTLSGKTINRLVIKTALGFTLNTATNGGGTQGSDEFWGFGSGLVTPVLDLSNASLTAALGGYYPMNGNNSETRFLNVIVPNAYNTNVSGFVLATAYSTTDCGANKYAVNGETLTASLSAPSSITAITNITSETITTLKVVGDLNTIDLSTVAAGLTIDLTEVTGGTGTITVPSDVTVLCKDAAVESRVLPATNVKNVVISCAASELASKVAALAPYKPISITLTGELTDAIMATLGGTDMSEVTRIDLSAATVATGSDIANLTVPASLKQLVLPSAVNSTSPSIPDALTLRLGGLSLLDYVYIPTTNDGATTPDYVYVMKTGGLAQAFENESTLCSGKYIKVASNVALGTADVDFSALTNKPTQYIILDFSEANMTPAMLQNYRTPTADYSETYRLIMPDGWTGNDLANIAAVPVAYRGTNFAAVYSYAGTTLRILGISNSYSPTALKAPRIVRDGTATVEFVSGTYNDELYGRFTPSMLAAVNNAGKTSGFKDQDGNAVSVTEGNEMVGNSIISFRILTEKLWSANGNLSSYFTALTFENPVVTTINLTGLKNDTYGANQAIVNLNGCTNLQGLNLDGVHAASVTANVSTLQTIGMTGIAIEGNLSFQGAAITVFTASGRVAGDIDLTNCNQLGSIDIVNVEFKSSNDASTLQGSSLDSNLTTGDLIVTRNSTTNAEDGVYTGETSGYAKITGNIRTSETFGTGLIESDKDGRIYPQISAVASAPYSEDEAGYKMNDCMIELTLDGETTNYNTLAAALSYIATEAGETLTPCNLTINTTSDYSLTSDDIATINNLSFSYYDEYGSSDGDHTGKSTNNLYMYRAATLDLDGATVANNSVLAALDNASIRNIILPRDLDKDVVNATTFEKMSAYVNFNGAVSLNAVRTQVVGYISKPGSLRTILQQVELFRPNVYNYMQGITLPNVTLSGKLLASDIATNYNNLEGKAGYVGNYAESPEVAAGTGELYIAAFENVNTLRNLDLTNAIFVDANNPAVAKCDNMTLSALGWAGIVSLKMPTNSSMNEVPKYFLRNCQQISYLCIPYNYEYIGDEAFYLAGLYWITTTDANGAEIDNGIDTYTFSKNLKQIGSTDGTVAPGTTDGWPNTPTNPVFGAVNSGRVHDVYVLADDAPKCYRGAFASGMTYGWGGFDGGNVYCREKYMNGSTLYTVLHFPQGLTEAQEKLYTDITKVYTKKDQTGAVDANGDTPEWPTFSELGRSYNQAIRGLVWGDWNITGNVDSETGKLTGEINGGAINFDPKAYPAETTLNNGTTPSNLTGVTGLERFDLNYVGWHEFVLSKATYVAPDETVVNEEIIRNYELDNYWYTFCIPFDMTVNEVAQLLGVPASTPDGSSSNVKIVNNLNGVKQTENVLPEIRTMKSVTRNSSTNTVAIQTSMSLSSAGTGDTHPATYYMPATNSYEANASGVYLRAGYPYYIRPYKLSGMEIAGNNLGKQVMTRYTFTMAASAMNHEETEEVVTPVTSFARPYENHKMQATEDSPTGGTLSHTDAEHNGQPYNYTFIGQFWKQNLPNYCFYMSNHEWYHYTNPQTGWYWNPYICIIMVTDESTSEEAKGGKFRDEDGTTYPQKQGNDAKGGEVFDNNLQIVYNNGLDDNFGASAREYHFVFDDDIMDYGEGNQVTAIEVLDGVRVAPVRGKVYNMAGQHVGNSLEGLAKGMYIVNGKKYVIK